MCMYDTCTVKPVRTYDITHKCILAFCRPFSHHYINCVILAYSCTYCKELSRILPIDESVLKFALISRPELVEMANDEQKHVPGHYSGN